MPGGEVVASMSSPPDRHVVYGWQAQSTKPLARIVRSERIYLWDAAGRRIMDFCSGQINVNVGYGHPAILAAMREQMAEMTYVAPGFETEPRSKLAALIAERLPAGLDQVFFTNSGSESVEVAIKISRAVTRRTKIYSAWRSYHGNSAGASAISGDPRRLFAEPAVPGVSKFHGATCYCCPFGERSPPGCGYACLSSLTRAVLLEGPETIAAIVVEPIVGTSGLYVPPAEYLRGIRRLCDEHGILLVFDETMTGWGRTGRWFAWEHSDVRPDMITTAKGITSAYVPLGATIMTARLREVFLDRVFVAGSSTEGHALGCAAGIANIQVYESEGLIEHSRLLGDYLLEQLRAVARSEEHTSELQSP